MPYRKWLRIHDETCENFTSIHVGRRDGRAERMRELHTEVYGPAQRPCVLLLSSRSRPLRSHGPQSFHLESVGRDCIRYRSIYVRPSAVAPTKDNSAGPSVCASGCRVRSTCCPSLPARCPMREGLVAERRSAQKGFSCSSDGVVSGVKAAIIFADLKAL